MLLGLADDRRGLDWRLRIGRAVRRGRGDGLARLADESVHRRRPG